MNKNIKFHLFLYCILIICVREIISQKRRGCGQNEWKCKSGECIADDERCDGAKNCRDGSDETAAACVHVHCPAYSYRCAYGGCVSGTASCNGIQECADNSDETSALCPDAVKNFSINGNCPEDSLQCDSGQCTPRDNGCDGKIDCDDGSDETVKLCTSGSFDFCPDFAFRCGYGACVNGNAACNGVKDCVDGSDEAPGLCGHKHTTKRPDGGGDHSTGRPLVVTPPNIDLSDSGGCKIDYLSNVRIALEANPTEFLSPGQYVNNFESIVYECAPEHILEGTKTNRCISGKWSEEQLPTCSRYCSNIVISGVTFQATCEYDGIGISCNKQPLKPGTRAKISCQVGYQKPEGAVTDIIICGDDGRWDTLPFRCQQVCGVEPVQSTPFIIGGDRTNITRVPWHVGIYSNLRGPYTQICGGTILNAKVVLSAAHCFWDVQNDRVYHKSHFAVAAGKYYRDYYAQEPLPPQFFNVTELYVAQGYRDIHLHFHDDLAVVVVSDFIKFRSHISPICIEWQVYSNQSIRSNRLGLIAGWGLNENLMPSTELLSLNLKTLSYDDCIEKADTEYKNLVTGDKFCVGGSIEGEAVCQGDSGGGFVIPKQIGNQKIYFLWGVVSNGLTSQGQCSGNYLTAFTNIQYHSQMIIEYETRYRPK